MQRSIYRSLRERDALLQPNKIEEVAESLSRLAGMYYAAWTDSATQAESLWLQVFKELDASRTHPDPEFLLPSQETFTLAEALLREFEAGRRLTPPELTLDGEGNLYFEWKSNNKKFSICISDNIAGSYIYISLGREYNALPLTRTNLHEAIDSFLA
jgi:hypothetical protein